MSLREKFLLTLILALRFIHLFPFRKIVPFWDGGLYMDKIATAVDPIGGVAMDVYTDQPGVQLFTPPDFSYMTGKGGVTYGVRPAFCLETQHFADGMSHKHFPSIVLQAGEVFSSETIYLFYVV